MTTTREERTLYTSPQQETQEPVMWAMWRESTGWLAASCEKTRDECIANCIEAAVSEGLPPDFAATRGWIPRPLASPTSQGDALDAARLDWLDEDAGNHVTRVGKTWYTRPTYGHPYRKHKNLRAAIDAARAAQEGK